MPGGGGGGGFGGFGSSAPPNTPGGLFGMGDYTSGALIGGGLGILGGVLSGMGQGKMTEAQLQQARELALREEQLRREQLAQQQAQVGLQASQQDPLAQQRSRQQAALMAAILPQLRNASVSSNIPGMDRYIPQISGGLRIPEGGFDASTLEYFSPESRASAEGQYWRQAAPFTPPPDLSTVGYGQAGVGKTLPAQQAYAQTQAENKKRNDALLAALNQQAQGSAQKKKGGSALKTVASVGMAALPYILKAF